MFQVFSFFSSGVAKLWTIWTAYNPERHYMRGPGPKWHEKHASLRTSATQGEPPMRIDGSGRIISSR